MQMPPLQPTLHAHLEPQRKRQRIDESKPLTPSLKYIRNFIHAVKAITSDDQQDAVQKIVKTSQATPDTFDRLCASLSTLFPLSSCNAQPILQRVQKQLKAIDVHGVPIHNGSPIHIDDIRIDWRAVFARQHEIHKAYTKVNGDYTNDANLPDWKDSNFDDESYPSYPAEQQGSYHPHHQHKLDDINEVIEDESLYSDLECKRLQLLYSLAQHRDRSCIRAVEFIRRLVLKAKKNDFRYYSSDIIFLLRFPIMNTNDRVGKFTKRAVVDMIRKWEELEESILDMDSADYEILGYAECLHARMHMKYHADAQTNNDKNNLALTLYNYSVDRFLRFNPSAISFPPMSPRTYCAPCGQFIAKSKQKKPTKKNTATSTIDLSESDSTDLEHRVVPPKKTACTHERLVSVVDFQSLCESLVWTSVFDDIGISPMHTANASVKLEDTIRLLRQLRPYSSLQNMGLTNFNFQCYFITHLLFILSGWGSYCLPIHLFIEEYLFLRANMALLIRLKDCELVGEVLQSLRILGMPDHDSIMLKGIGFLLEAEKKTVKRHGSWMPPKATFYSQYHASYCSIIGLAPMRNNPSNLNGGVFHLKKSTELSNNACDLNSNKNNRDRCQESFAKSQIYDRWRPLLE